MVQMRGLKNTLFKYFAKILSLFILHCIFVFCCKNIGTDYSAMYYYVKKRFHTKIFQESFTCSFNLRTRNTYPCCSTYQGYVLTKLKILYIVFMGIFLCKYLHIQHIFLTDPLEKLIKISLDLLSITFMLLLDKYIIDFFFFAKKIGNQKEMK